MAVDNYLDMIFNESVELQRSGRTRSVSKFALALLEALPELKKGKSVVISKEEYASYTPEASERTLRNGPNYRELRNPRLEKEGLKARSVFAGALAKQLGVKENTECWEIKVKGQNE